MPVPEAVACVELIKALGMPHDQAILCDSQGVIYNGREKGMNQWKSAHAINTDARSLADAVKGADVFFGLSVADSMTPKMVADMADNPIIFAMANPDPEITPEQVKAVRGRCDHGHRTLQTTPTRSTMYSVFPISSAVPSMCVHRPSTLR